MSIRETKQSSMGSKRKQPESNEKSQFEKQISVDSCGEKLPTPIDTSQQHNIELNDVDTACSSPSRDCVVVREKNPVINETKVSDVSLAPSTKKASEMWAHFAKVEVNGKLKGECNYCKKQLVAGGKVGTTSLHDHFKSCPRRKHKDIKQNLLVATHKSGDPLLTLGNYQFDQEVGRKKLARMIILHEYPLNMVDHKEFKDFCTYLQPLFKVVTRNTIKQDILNMFEVEKDKIKNLFDKNRGRIATTCDMWTSNHQNKGYMTVTSHFIDNSWQLQSRLLRFAYVPSPHTKEVLSKILTECFFAWNLDRKLSTLTVDNCTTNDAVVNVIKSMIPSNWLLLRGSLFHMRCCAHILNLIVQDGLTVLGDGLRRIRESVAYWTASPRREERFEEAASQCFIPSTKKLALDCKTRWNSTYLMIEIALIYREVFKRLSVVEKSCKCFPSEVDWETAYDICEKLKVFYDATLAFSATKRPTTNICFPIICDIKIKLSNWLTCGVDVIENMAKKMMEKFDKYWHVIHHVMGVANILDPRFKIKYCEFFYSQIYGNDYCREEIDRIKNICYDLVSEYQSKQASNQSRASSNSSTMEVVPQYLNAFEVFMQKENQEDFGTGKLELDHYLNENTLPRSGEEFDVLAWWKLNGAKYPTLQMIARDLLAIHISTVASESTFSTSGRIVSTHRSRLHSRTIEALMCVQNWLRTDLEGHSSSSKLDPQYTTIHDDIDEFDEENVNGRE